ncbi:Uncharacterized protein APZ42_006184, partial [Daphnia magna]
GSHGFVWFVFRSHDQTNETKFFASLTFKCFRIQILSLRFFSLSLSRTRNKISSYLHFRPFFQDFFN